MFTPYKGFAYMLRKEAKAQHWNPDLHDALVDMAASSLIMCPVQSQDHRAIVEEAVHYLLGHRVICVSAALAAQLAQTEIALQLDHISLPYSLFELCVDDSYRPTGFPLPGCLACVRPDEATRTALGRIALESFAKEVERTGSGRPPVSQDLGWMANSVTLRWRTPLDEGICHAAIDYRKYEGKDCDAVIDDMGTIAEVAVGAAVALDKVEKDTEKILLRIVLGALCYLNTARPEAEPHKDRNRPHLGNVAPQIELLGRTAKKDASFHLRKAHWRRLAHQRFERDETGRIRIVWVRPAVVNPGSEAKEKAADLEDLGGEGTPGTEGISGIPS